MTGFRAFLKGTAFFMGFALLGFLVVLVWMRWFIGGSSLVVPDLAGRDMVHAVDVLSRMNLRLKISGEEFNPHLPANYIISQEPLPGTAVKKGRSILVVVSRGAQEAVVPHVEGVTLREAQITLQQKGFRVGSVGRVPHHELEKDRIILQTPPPESSLSRGGAVGLLVSAGKEDVVLGMPDVVGLLIGEAEQTLDKAGLTVGNLRYQAGEENWRVIEQKPLPGTPVRQGTQADMVVMMKKGR